MTDIVERLLEPVIDTFFGPVIEPIKKEAADEIERLRKDYALAWENHLLHEQIFVLTEAKIERLREALQKVCNSLDDNLPAIMTKNIALAALGLPLREMKEGE
jgi:hypothetical protein